MIGPAVAIALSIICMYLCGRIADHRGRSIKAWVWLAAILGPIALVLVALLPSQRKELAV